MDLEKLHKIDEDLTICEVAQLKFLCTDLVQKKRLEPVTDAKGLFLRLEEQGLLDDELLVSELLSIIRRLDLLEILEKSKEQVEGNVLQRVSPYRKMLFNLYEDMTDENLRSVKFLSELPRAKLETSSSFLDVVVELEKVQRLGEDNLDELQNILSQCDKQLAYKIEEFKNRQQDQKQVGGRHPLQEMSNHDRVPCPDDRDRSVIASDAQKENVNKESDMFHKEEDCYTISHRPVGHCLIINNYNFEQRTRLGNRRGTHKDKDELERVFKKMHFKIEVRNDLTASEMLSVTKEFSERDHSQMDMFACCVLSHGEKGTVLGIDGEPVEIRDLTLPFAKCLTLASKPKLFFIQACQGKEAQEGVWMRDGEQDRTEEGIYEEDAHRVIQQSIPIEADFLIGMATVAHHQSFRHTKEGSIYIQELCKQLEILCPRQEDILSILTKVNCEVSTRILNGYKQMPEPRYTLRRKLILPMD